jgi:predicted MFS family arabinose efflux permease
MNAIAFSAGMIGAIVVTVPLELLLRVWPWRQAFMLIVALAVIVSLVLWLWVPERRAARQGKSFGEEMRELGLLMTDPAFVRLAVCLGASQCAAIALQTLWIATWLRDVAGYTAAEVAQGLLAVNSAMIVGYLAFGRAADALQRRGRNELPLLLGGVGLSSLTLATIILAPRFFPLLLWCIFVVSATGVVLGYAIVSRRYPKAMAGRANTAINVFAFVGSFAGQWGIGLVLDRWPQTAQGYAPEAYTWALGAVWVVQLAGLAWLWWGRLLLERPSTAAA